jgi:hypothetical protein
MPSCPRNLSLQVLFVSNESRPTFPDTIFGARIRKKTRKSDLSIFLQFLATPETL